MKKRFSNLLKSENSLLVLLFALVFVVICILPQFFVTKPVAVDELTTTPVSYDSIDLTWEKTDGAAEYYIYRSERGKLFIHIGTAKEASFCDDGVEPGIEYRYKVAASNLVKTSKKSPVSSAMTKLDAPVITADISKGTAVVHIQNVDGAEGYTVYRNGEEYSQLEKQNGEESIYEDEEAEDNTKYRYTVTADRNRSQSEQSESVSLKLISAGPIIATTDVDDLVFSWNGNKKYTSYKVYRGDKLVAETKECSYKTPIKSGTYNLTLTGYGKNIESPVTHQVFRVEKDDSADQAANYLGQARNDIDKRPGDGSGKEVCKSGFSYSSSGRFNWTYVFRPKDRNKANTAANMCELALKNNNIGYCRNGSKYGSRAPDKLARAVDYDLSKITTKTGLSCGDLICLCNHYAGLSECYDGSGLGLANKYKQNSNFECIRYQRGMKLLRGDVVITAHSSGKQNHVAMCLTDADYCMGVKISEVIISKSR
ncbi:MAG: hypothetical protein E7226_04795 [Clostridiales bacterium]|nr:hypothetical protein [Clostridiales bacterium]